MRNVNRFPLHLNLIFHSLPVDFSSLPVHPVQTSAASGVDAGRNRQTWRNCWTGRRAWKDWWWSGQGPTRICRSRKTEWRCCHWRMTPRKCRQTRGCHCRWRGEGWMPWKWLPWCRYRSWNWIRERCQHIRTGYWREFGDIRTARTWFGTGCIPSDWGKIYPRNVDRLWQQRWRRIR